MSKAIKPVDGYIRKVPAWQAELTKLRSLLLDSELTEEVKWRVPCYTYEGSNVAFIGRFKDWCGLSFVKGVLLKDPKKILIQQTAQSQSVRIIRFTSVAEIDKLEPTLRAYIDEAVALEKAGAKVTLKKIDDYALPEELQSKLDASPALKKAFRSLTPGRQRGYILHVSSAKQSKTRAARVEKHVERILAGKGLDDE